MNRRRAHWHYVLIHHERRMIFIADDNGPLSVTNDAEQVCYAAAWEDEDGRPINTYRLFYRDTQGDWDEIVHTKGKFAGFKPCLNRKANLGGML